MSTLPSDWDIVEVGRACRIENGCPFESRFFSEKEGIPLIRIRDVHSGRSETYYSGPYDNRFLVKNGDLLIGMDGEFRVRKWAAGKGLLNQRVCRIVPDESQIEKDFVYYSIGGPLKRIEDFTPYTTVKHISATQIRAIRLPNPPRAEQRKIAAVLGLAQRAMEQQEKLLALTTELKRALLNQLFTHGLHREPQKQTEIGPIPESWQISTMDEVGDVIYGIQAAVASNLKPIGTPILTNKNITLDGTFDLEKVNYFPLKTARHMATLLKKGDLLFNWRSGSKEHVGKTALFELDGEYTHSSFILRIRTRDPITSRFLFYFLNWLRASGYFVKRHSFAVNAKFNKSAINRLMVALPEQSERVEIVRALDSTIAKEDFHRRMHATLSALFRTLLHELMTARTRVHNLDLSELEAATKD